MAPAEDIQAKKRRTRRDYPFHLEYRTRWSDNDMYAHLNNVVYAHLIDSIVNTYLVSHCGLDPYHHNPLSPSSISSAPSGSNSSRSSQIGLVVSSHCAFFAPVSFPDVLDLGLRVTRLGASSADYEVGIFKRGEEAVKAVGGFTHVFVDRGTGRPAEGGMEEGIRRGLERLVVTTPTTDSGDAGAGSDSGAGKGKGSKL
ncbi:thioesterase [Thermoascus aurantiacus ATCC 26904]